MIDEMTFLSSLKVCTTRLPGTVVFTSKYFLPVYVYIRTTYVLHTMGQVLHTYGLPVPVPRDSSENILDYMYPAG
jgi:hypothetical protein